MYVFARKVDCIGVFTNKYEKNDLRRIFKRKSKFTYTISIYVHTFIIKRVHRSYRHFRDAKMFCINVLSCMTLVGMGCWVNEHDICF